VSRSKRAHDSLGIRDSGMRKCHELLVDRLYDELSKPVFILDRRVGLCARRCDQPYQQGDHIRKL
jgi:hypothetical protein